MTERFADADTPAFLSGGGEMGIRMRHHDWSTSVLGALDAWPLPLKTLVEVMLASKQPMFIAWGRERTLLYNDGYTPMLGTKHPSALSRGFFDVWPEVAAELVPMFDRVFAGEPVHEDDISLVLDRGRGPEEAHFAFSYTPVRLESGEIAGLFSPCLETTEQVRAERHMDAERERQRLMLRQMPGFVGMLSGPDLVYEYVNDAYVEICERTEFVGRSFLEVFPDLEGQDFYKIFANAFHTGESAVVRGMELRLHGRTETQYVDFVLEPIRNNDGVVVGLFVGGYETTDVYRGQAHLRLMVNELNHRVKNSLATVQAIAAQTFRNIDDIEQSKKDFSSRLVSLAQAHDILTETNWVGATMREIVDRSVEPHDSDAGERFSLDGPHLVLEPKAALATAMALHELCTNAAKYGALSVEGGHVQILWRVDAGQDDRRLLLTWVERGGPPVMPPTRRGFGSRLVEYGLAAELGGEVKIDYRPAGVVCTIDAPLLST